MFNLEDMSPAILCLMTNKSEAIYSATLFKIKFITPQMNPLSAMGDWETAPRNGIKKVYPNIALYHNQAVWIRITKLGLVSLFHI